MAKKTTLTVVSPLGTFMGRNYTVWVIGGQQADGTWVEVDRLSGRGMQVEALRRVSSRYYDFRVPSAYGLVLGRTLVFTAAQWREQQAADAAQAVR